MFRIYTNADVDPRALGIWVVQSYWLGRVRTVFVGDIFACCQFARSEP